MAKHYFISKSFPHSHPRVYRHAGLELIELLLLPCCSVFLTSMCLSLQEHFSDRLEGTMQRNSLCNLLVFNYNPSSKSETFPFNARLLYGDLCCSLPTEVVISCARKCGVDRPSCHSAGGRGFFLFEFRDRRERAVISVGEKMVEGVV